MLMVMVTIKSCSKVKDIILPLSRNAVTVKTFIILRKILIHLFSLKKPEKIYHGFHKIIKRHNCFDNIDNNNKNVS